MRLILAGLFVVVGIFLVFLLLGPWLEHLPPLLSMLLIAVIAGVGFLGLCLAALFLFNAPDPTSKSAAEYEKQMREWEAQGLLTVTNYKFTRAFRADEDEAIEEEDEDNAEVSGPHYFFELDNGTVLYLCGHYLPAPEGTLDGPDAFNGEAPPYLEDADLITDLALMADELDARHVREGHFSYTISSFELTVKRHSIEDRIVQVSCDIGPIMDTAPATFWNNPYWQSHSVNDGDILTDCAYDELLADL